MNIFYIYEANISRVAEVTVIQASKQPTPESKEPAESPTAPKVQRSGVVMRYYPLMCSNFFYLYSTPVASHVAGSYTTSRRADEGRRPRAEARALTSLQHTQGGDTQSQDGEGVYPKLLRLVLPVAGFLLYIYICLCLEAVSCCRKLHSRLQSQKSQLNRRQRQRCDDRVW